MSNVLYELLLYFFIYSFLGWCAEVIFAAVNHGTFVNRGFLNGPVCPIYGHGMLLVLVILEPLKDNLAILFFGSFLLTSLLELLTGFILEKCFHTKWWDYSKEPFNIKGYVCLKFSLLWGLACVLIINVLHPLVAKLVGLLPHTLGIVLICLFSAMIVADYIITLIGMLKLPRRLRAVAEVQSALRKVSDGIGSGLSEGVFNAREKGQQLKEKGQEFRESAAENPELKALQEKYHALTSQKNFVHQHLMKAFPDMKSNQYAESIERIRDELLAAIAARRAAKHEARLTRRAAKQAARVGTKSDQ